MKNIRKHIYVLVGLLTLFTSCESWFDVDPRTEIKEKDLFKDENGFFDALVGVYSIMGRQALYGDELTMGTPEAMVQNYYISSTAHPLYYMTKFDYENTRVRPTINAFWTNLYEAVVNVNNLLENLEKALSLIHI